MKKRKKDILRTIFWKSNLVILLFFCGCGNPSNEIDEWLEGYDAVAIMFLTPDCPLAQNYTRPFLDLNEDFGDSTIAFIGVLPGTLYTEKEIEEYRSDYSFNVPILEDVDYTISHQYQPEVTPEFLLITQNGVLYQGALDNWMKGLGQYRKRPTEFYLRRAIEQWKSDSTITIQKTPAYGCFIEYP